MTELFSWLPIILIPIFIIIIIIGLSYWWYRKEKKKLSLIHSSQFTNTDKAYLDKIVRTASDRSMWKRDNEKKLRKIPSKLIQEKS
jgi:Mg2+/citrate symporter